MSYGIFVASISYLIPQVSRETAGGFHLAYFSSYHTLPASDGQTRETARRLGYLHHLVGWLHGVCGMAWTWTLLYQRRRYKLASDLVQNFPIVLSPLTTGRCGLLFQGIADWGLEVGAIACLFRGRFFSSLLFCFSYLISSGSGYG